MRILLRRLTDVARRAKGHVELLIRAEGDVSPTMPTIGRELRHERRCRRRIELRLDVVITGNFVVLGDVECATLQRDSVRYVESLCDHAHLATSLAFADGVDLAGRARADEYGARVAADHRARVVDAIGPHFDPESGWQF